MASKHILNESRRARQKQSATDVPVQRCVLLAGDSCSIADKCCMFAMCEAFGSKSVPKWR